MVQVIVQFIPEDENHDFPDQISMTINDASAHFLRRYIGTLGGMVTEQHCGPEEVDRHEYPLPLEGLG